MEVFLSLYTNNPTLFKSQTLYCFIAIRDLPGNCKHIFETLKHLCMKKVYTLLQNPDVQGAITITLIVATIVVAFLMTLGK